jgi:hypothetical protein
MNRYDDELPPSEEARDKRRDRDADARARTGMRTGLAKQFKQVLDAQKRRGGEAAELLDRRAAESATGQKGMPRPRRRNGPADEPRLGPESGPSAETGDRPTSRRKS